MAANKLEKMMAEHRLIKGSLLKSVKVGDEFSNDDETTFAAVLIDMHNPDMYRVQVYDHKGFYGHYLNGTMKEVVDCLMDFLGYDLKPAPGSMDEIVGGRKKNPEKTFLFPGDMLEVVDSFTQRVYFPPTTALSRIINPEEEDWIQYRGLLRGTKLYHFVFMPRDEEGTVLEEVNFAVKKVGSILKYCTLL